MLHTLWNTLFKPFSKTSIAEQAINVDTPRATERIDGLPNAKLEFGEAQRASGEYWDRVSANAGEIFPRTAWWNDPVTLRHINRIVCGEAVDGAHEGFHRRLAGHLSSISSSPAVAISVGSGNGAKEIQLLKAGIVGSFDCYEAGAGACEQGRTAARHSGLSERLRFHNTDVFKERLPSKYDLVYWNNSLHHMPDTAAAIQWSFDNLRQGGLFAMDDYVGASRFQHSAQLMEWTNRSLALLPDRLLRRPPPDTTMVPRVLGLIDQEALIKIDPTEASDSGNILTSLKKVFPNSEVIATGGPLYFVGLNEVFHNFESPDDLCLLQALLLVDEAIAQLVETQYAVAFAVK